MREWEYYVATQAHAGDGEALSFFAYMGGMGWELVQVRGRADEEAHLLTYYFNRPKSVVGSFSAGPR